MLLVVRPTTATVFIEGVAWPVREGLSNNRLQQTARWQFAAPLLNRVFSGPRATAGEIAGSDRMSAWRVRRRA